MYCPKCGKENKDNKYCSGCGYDLINKPPIEKQSVNNSSVINSDNSTYVKSKRSNKGCIVAIVVGVVLFILAVIGIVLAVFFFIGKMMDNVSSNDYVEFSNLQIPTIYKALDEEISICGFSTYDYGDSYIVEYKYCDELSAKEIKEYVEYLKNDGFESIDGNTNELYKYINGNTLYVKIHSSKITYEIYINKNNNNGEIEV